MTAQEHGLTRRMWHQLEPVHAVFWYAPQVFAEAAALGYDVETRWPSYFAWRLAPSDLPFKVEVDPHSAVPRRSTGIPEYPQPRPWFRCRCREPGRPGTAGRDLGEH
jgi:hypothetical protein